VKGIADALELFVTEEIVGNRCETEENKDQAKDGDCGSRESVASAHVDQGPILRDNSWNVNGLTAHTDWKEEGKKAKIKTWASGGWVPRSSSSFLQL
jgi:hypothetical protein